MGKLSSQWARGGGIRRARSANKDPLRKIVDHEPRPYPHAAFQVLECGHKLRPREDLIGPVDAEVGQRRRCPYCAAGATPPSP